MRSALMAVCTSGVRVLINAFHFALKFPDTHRHVGRKFLCVMEGWLLRTLQDCLDALEAPAPGPNT